MSGHPISGQRVLVRLGPGAVLIASMACRVLAIFPATPTSTPASTATPVALYQHLTLASRTSIETGQPFGYTMTLHTPYLSGSDDPRVQAFNAEMALIVTAAAADFKTNLVNAPPTPDSGASSFDVRYEVRSPPGDVLSLQFEIEGYVTGAAHPFHVSHSVNFDLQAGRDLALADLFRPGADYLQAISDYCISQLQSRSIGFSDFSAGAAPTADNYRNWNITDSGLLITFDEYQVAAYAAGPQIVAVPYSSLQPLILDPGPLTPYLP
jgi:hypothetical protein